MKEEILQTDSFFELHQRFIEVFESRKGNNNWKIEERPSEEPYILYGYHLTNIEADINEINSGNVSVSTLYELFDSFENFIKDNFINPVIFEHLNLKQEGEKYKYVMVYKTYIFGLN